jgi:anti-anti-sigma factor
MLPVLSPSVVPFSTAPPLLCTVTVVDSGAAWVHLVGEIDLLTSPLLEGSLREAQLRARFVVLDAREVTFIDSAGVHVILGASKISQSSGARLMLIPSEAVEVMLTITGVRDQISIFDPSSSESASVLHLQ